jgi:hypothetical protein
VRTGILGVGHVQRHLLLSRLDDPDFDNAGGNMSLNRSSDGGFVRVPVLLLRRLNPSPTPSSEID